MRALGRSAAVATLLVAGLALPGSASGAEPDWEVVELQPLQEGGLVEVNDINASGTSVGESDSTPVSWDADGVPTELELPEGCVTTDGGTAISDNGHIVAGGACPGVGFVALHWSPDGTFEVLPTPAYHPESVDDHGIVVGWSVEEVEGGGHDSNGFAFLTGHPLLLLPDGGGQSIALAHIGWGYVVGCANQDGTSEADDVATGWYGDQHFPLVPLGLGIDTCAYAVNEAGVALVRAYDDDDTAERAFLIAPGGRIQLLDVGGDKDRVVDLNDAAIAVGTRFTGTTADGRFYVGDQSISLSELVSAEDLAAFGLTRPEALNDAAWVVGQEGGHGWLLRPPSS